MSYLKLKIGRAGVAVLAIIGIVVMEVVALSHGIDGIALGASCGAVGGIAGWYLRPCNNHGGGSYETSDH